jgi:CHAT domain-containing protein
LTISQLAQLAFLSACSTAENQVAHLADEAMHIASAFFIAGFSHAVGSMWPSDDCVCVRVAERFYASLAEAGFQEGTETFARALHDAVLEVRLGKLREPLL